MLEIEDDRVVVFNEITKIRESLRIQTNERQSVV